MASTNQHQNELTENGFSILPDVYASEEVGSILNMVESAIELGTDGNIKSSLGETYAARNLVTLNPELLHAWSQPILIELLTSTLGANFGLVRVLYFDKHPNRTWSLPWHKDMTIAVKDNSLSSNQLTKPTRKSGIDHVEASTELLANMLTLRIHLDPVTEDNGPLEVAVGSHKHGKQISDNHNVAKILCSSGSVLAMRPLLSHASGSSTEGTEQHRRILHLEFSGDRDLPDGFQWNLFDQTASKKCV